MGFVCMHVVEIAEVRCMQRGCADTQIYPYIGQTTLQQAFDDTYLTEHAVGVADAIAPRGEVEGGHRVEKARCQAAEATVAQRSIAFLLL